MKNRKTAVVAFLIVGVLCLTVGFAAVLSDTLNVDGFVAVNVSDLEDDFDAKVYFVKNTTEIVSKPNGVDNANISGVIDTVGTGDGKNAGDKYTITISEHVFKAIGDTVVMNVDVKNDCDEQAVNVAVNAIANGSNAAKYFEISAKFGTDASKEIAGKGTETLTITIKLKYYPSVDLITGSNPTAGEQEQGNFSLTLTATPVEPTTPATATGD